MRDIASYLGIPDPDIEEMDSRAETLVSGTCEWLLNDRAFVEWRGANPTDSFVTDQGSSRCRVRGVGPQRPARFFWLVGAAGTGKSYLASRVIQHLNVDRECSFYFLKHSDRSKLNVGGLLKTLAFQMARRHAVLRRWLLSLAQENSLTAEHNDFRTIWKQLFMQKIFRTDLQKRQYWVVDAIDEGKGGHELISLLREIPDGLPYSVFLTSRDDPRIERLIKFHKLQVIKGEVDLRCTLRDIRTYLQANIEELPVSDPNEVQALISKLVKKSNGSFLWTHLVVQKLSGLWQEKARNQTIEDVPEEMNELYQSILDDMAETESRSPELPKATLRWAVCAMQPMTVQQFQEAVELDLDDRVNKFEDAIRRTCGQLVSIQQGKVQLIHETVRDFLLERGTGSEFAVNKAKSHSRLAIICLGRLIDEVKRQRRQWTLHSPLRSATSGATVTFYDYASSFFSEHVVKSSSTEEDTPINQLCSFLQTCTLNWIEDIARKADLSTLTQTGKNLKSFVDGRNDFLGPLNPEMRMVRGWAKDLIHIVAAFGHFLLDEPAAIHRVIPPLCPRNSTIYQTFGKLSHGLEVVGRHSTSDWTERISSMSFTPDYVTALACVEKVFAVGTRNGQVVVYDAATCQETWHFECGENVRHLIFAKSSDWLIISSRSKLSMYNYESHTRIWQVPIASEHMALEIFEEEGPAVVFAATKANELVSFECENGRQSTSQTWERVERATRREPPPTFVHIDTELSYIALVYRNRPLRLYNLRDLSRPQYVDNSSNIGALAFNPASNMMAIALFHGELKTVGLWNLQEVKSVDIESASHLAVTSDGKTLIVATNAGSIQIFDFDSLNILYTIPYEGSEIVALKVSPNGLRFLDIRRQLLNVWEPTALVRRKDGEDTTSEGQTSYGTAASQFIHAYSAGYKSAITAMVFHHTAEYVFCGKENGSVTIYEIKDLGKPMQFLYEHGGAAISFMDWNPTKSLLVSSDNSSRIKIHQVKLLLERSAVGLRYRWASTEILNVRVHSSIRQILFTSSAEWLLVSNTTTDQIWKLDGTPVLQHSCSMSRASGTLSQKWAKHPTRRRLIEIERDGLHVVEWDRHRDTAPAMQELALDNEDETPIEVRGAHIHVLRFDGDIWAAYDLNPTTAPILWTQPPSSGVPMIIPTLDRFKQIVPSMRYLIGLFRSQLIFLDSGGWICSMLLNEAGLRDRPSRRFPIPHYWQKPSRQPLALVTTEGDVVIASGEELAVVKRGLIGNAI